MKRLRIVGASLGECVHVQGVYNFLRLCEGEGHETVFLGPAVSIDRLVSEIKMREPDAVAVSYRLTPENAEALLGQLKERIESEGLHNIEFLFGGTPPVADVARTAGVFRVVADGTNDDAVAAYISGDQRSGKLDEIPPQQIIGRIKWKSTPLLRTHFGLPDVETTVKGIGRIAESGLLDVISLGTDQDAQANFFHPERQNPDAKGAGGVPVRSKEDFVRLYDATRRGNFPLMRTYAGTDDLIRLAELYEDAFGNAWSAVPIFWFNAMDGRGPHELEKSIEEHLKLIKWNSEKGIPVEILEAHHWAMRWAHDSLVVASAYLGANIAKRLGVRDYIHQYMFNVPPENSFSNELAKMNAIKKLLGALEDGSFSVYHQTRTGLPSFPNDLEEARAQLATSTLLQLQLEPDIVHVVNYSEPHHAATPEDVINSAKIVNRVIRNSERSPKMTQDDNVLRRTNELVGEALHLYRHIEENGDITRPDYLCSIVTSGLFDAPMLKSNRFARGDITTSFFDGGCYAIDKGGRKVTEKERLREYEKTVSIGGN